MPCGREAAEADALLALARRRFLLAGDACADASRAIWHPAVCCTQRNSLDTDIVRLCRHGHELMEIDPDMVLCDDEFGTAKPRCTL